MITVKQQSTSAEAVVVYRVGLMYASACVDEDVSRSRIEQVVNDRYPTGVEPWQLSRDATFASGETNPCPCNTSPDRCHWLLEC